MLLLMFHCWGFGARQGGSRILPHPPQLPLLPAGEAVGIRRAHRNPRCFSFSRLFFPLRLPCLSPFLRWPIRQTSTDDSLPSSCYCFLHFPRQNYHGVLLLHLHPCPVSWHVSKLALFFFLISLLSRHFLLLLFPQLLLVYDCFLSLSCTIPLLRLCCLKLLFHPRRCCCLFSLFPLFRVVVVSRHSISTPAYLHHRRAVIFVPLHTIDCMYVQSSNNAVLYNSVFSQFF
mmetsp:Transcript_10110/g.14832  ORF Transcript_10110/g.14832 Transcript_10110/m.14832 type:complete len:230 (+) Transcript_10110:649-1338(+)